MSVTRMPSWLKEFAETKAAPLGFEFVGLQGSSHPRFYNADKNVYFTSALTPSDWRGEKNAVADMERLSGRKLPRPNAAHYKHKPRGSGFGTVQSSWERQMLGNLDSAMTDAEGIRTKIIDLFEEGSIQAANECRRLLARFQAIREFLADNGRHIPPITGDMQ